VPGGISTLEKVQNEPLSPQLPCKIVDAKILDLYQTRLAGSRFVKISQFRAREEAS
jgi:hypothetical protein